MTKRGMVSCVMGLNITYRCHFILSVLFHRKYNIFTVWFSIFVELIDFDRQSHRICEDP